MDHAALIAELLRAHGDVHTIILYGSRARGDATAESDIDVACFADVPETYRDARVWNELFLDGFVYPTNVATQDLTEDMAKLGGGSILKDDRSLAGPLLARIAAFEASPAPALPETERRMRRIWAKKMVARIRRGDVEASYRYHWLLFQLLEDHYPMSGHRYPGPKRAFADLAKRDPSTFAAFERALVPGARFDAVEALVDHLDRLYFGSESTVTAPPSIAST
ncbi:hypothetical protein BH09MYX1_BH09MYX1_33490 [soil metagenome]